MADLQSSWEESRSTMFEILLGVECLPEDASCSICFENPASIRCHHCGNSQLLCHQCDRLHHITNPFHGREAWFEKCFKPVQSCQPVDENEQVLDAGGFCTCMCLIHVCYACVFVHMCLYSLFVHMCMHVYMCECFCICVLLHLN